jgi:hypothetical protein
MGGYAGMKHNITIPDAIDQLDRLQNPEPWEPEVTGAAWEALEMAKEALKDIERIRKWMKGELHDHG